nr:NADH dehydrogenase subunit 4 [Euapta godeffroyi]
MLGVFIGYILCLLSLFSLSTNFFLSSTLVGSLILLFFSILCYSPMHTSFHFFIIDGISYPLLVLSSLVILLSVLASMSGINSNSISNHNGYLISLLLVGCFLFPCFMVNSFFGFFIFFEASIIPLLILIVRWGSQKERTQAGLYFVFFTLVGSYPLLLFLLFSYGEFGSSMIGIEGSSIFSGNMNNFYFQLILGRENFVYLFWWLAIIGFLIKLPIYGFHLWLPKAHVEAPVAGSMLLAALLLKLGGYGLIRIFSNLSGNVEFYVIPFCLIGSTITSIICLRQTDLKALIAYSSVGHMSLVAGGVLINSSWSVSGSLMLMVAHGLVSSCLFALANLIYERTGTRTLKVTRGVGSLSLLVSFWWLFCCLSNLGIPPFPNFVGEILLVLSSIGSSFHYFIILGLGLVFSGIYSLFIYQKVCTGEVTNYTVNFNIFNVRENILIGLHLIPLFILLGNNSLCFV